MSAVPGPRYSTRWRSPVIALPTLALAVIVAATAGSASAAVLRGLMVLAVVPCAVIDLESRLIPNRITGPAALVALVAGTVLDPGGELGRLAWTAGVAGFLLLAALAYPAGMGMGDVKLLGVIGLFLGRPVVVALFVALIASLLTGLVLAKRLGVRGARKTALPFGPYLAVGAVVAALAGDPLIHAYLHLRH